ncbi:MAG TPA: hypothetical protein VFY56_12085 [Propionibacteriaceae bacterium]|nr:hypothetical protein [Propionibacteriaceae bacterium]
MRDRLDDDSLGVDFFAVGRGRSDDVALDAVFLAVDAVFLAAGWDGDDLVGVASELLSSAEARDDLRSDF